MKKALITLCCALLLLSSISAGYCEDQPLQLTIKSDKQIYELGKQISIEVTLENVSKKEIIVCTRWLLSINIDFQVTSDGKKIETSPLYYKPQPPFVREDYVTLKPTEKTNQTFYLLGYVDIKKIGIYEIKGFYGNYFKSYSTSVLKDTPTDIDAWTGRIASNTIIIKVKDSLGN
jgi:hypothetical protein